MGPKELEKKFFKKIISYNVLKQLEKFNIKLKNLGLSEYINLTTTDKNSLEFLFLHEMINMNEIDIRYLVLNFLENYKDNILKPTDNFKDVEFFIVLSFHIINLVKKLDMEKNLKNSYL